MRALESTLLTWRTEGRLTSAESAVLELAARGLTHAEIASARGVRRSTLKKQVQNVCAKLDARSHRSRRRASRSR